MRRLRWLAVLLAWGLAPATARAWEIASFETRVDVHADATATVTETIATDFTGEDRHGIYRDIPIHYADRAGQHFVLRVRVREVADPSGRPWPYRLETAGRYRRIRIGDPDSTVTGLQTYQIIYDVQRGAVRFFPDHDECYWNLTGNEWVVPIRRVRAEIQLPLAATDLRAAAFIGAYGSTEALDAVEAGQGRVVLEPSRPFQPYEGLTAVVSWAKGAVHPPSAAQVLGWWLQDNWVYGIPLLVLLAMLWLWNARGRDPRPVRSQVVEYTPPDALTPAEIGTLMDQKANLQDITSTVIDLAVRGYLTIQPIEGGRWGRTRDYTLTCINPWFDDKRLRSHERELLKGIFGMIGDRAGKTVKLSDLDNVFYTHLPTLREQLYLELIGAGYIDGHPDKVRSRYMVLGVVIGGALFWILQATQPWHQVLGVASALAAILSGLIVIGFSFFMPRRTLKGAQATDRIFGFLEFLRRTDEDRIRRINDPKLFERLLPYALVFGIAEQWARVFEGLYTQPPSWYQGRWDTFSTRHLSRDLNRMSSSMGQTFTSAPRSSGSSGSWGGSGGGGGGFSGGGGGGGGGGAW